MYISVMKEDRVQKTVYITSIDLDEQIKDVMKLKGFGGFSAYVNHLICKDIENLIGDEKNQIERTYRATTRMYKDFSFSVRDAKEYSRKICLLQFPAKYESFIKNLD